MGKKSAQKANQALDAQSNISQQTLDLGKQLLSESAPARQQAQGYYTSIAGGDPNQLQRAVAPSISAATNQFYMARRNAQAMPPGGARDAALRNIDIQEAGAKTGIRTGGISEANARLASMGWGGTQAGVGAYGQASAGYGNVGGQYNQMASSKGAMAGQAAGGLGGFLGGLGG